jgi:hypothetical protein
MSADKGVIISLVPNAPDSSVGALLFNKLNDVYKTERGPETTYTSGPWKIVLEGGSDPFMNDIMISLKDDKNAVFYFKNLNPQSWNSMKEGLEAAVVRTHANKKIGVQSVADISEAKNIPEDIERKIKTYLGGRRKTRRTRRSRPQK